MAELETIEKLDLIGSNEFGSVYKSWDSEAKRYVAVLELHEKFRADADFYERVWYDVISRVPIVHDFLVSVYGVRRDLGWVIMEYMKSNLKDALINGPIDPIVVRTVMGRTLEVLDHLHAQEMLYGGVRPATLLLDSEGQFKLAFYPGLTIYDQIPPDRDKKYVAPELFDRFFGEVGPPFDLYCLGFAAYELLYGPSASL